MAFLTTIPLGFDESFLDISARFMFLFPVIGVVIGFLAGIYSFFTNNVLSLLFASLNTTLFSGSQKLLSEFAAQGLASVMTLAFILVLIGLQHTDGLVDVGNALGIRKATLKEKVDIAHDWTVTRSGALLALLVSFFTILLIFFTKTDYIIQSLIVAETSAKLAMVTSAWQGTSPPESFEKKRGKGGGIYATRISNDSLKAAFNKFLKRVDFTADQLTEVRLAIEPIMVKHIVTQITSAELKSLENNLIYTENKLKKVTSTLPQKEYAELGERNMEFHRLIAQATHNPVFMLTIDYLMDFIYEFRKSVFTPNIKHVTRVVKDHRDIFTSLKKGNAEEAEAKMLSHLTYLDMYQEEQHLDFTVKTN